MSNKASRFNGIAIAMSLAASLQLVACTHSPGAGGDHGQHQVLAANGPTEAGQGAFGALAEIVQMLNADPTTDWSQVNIDALRDHLVDMNALVLDAAVRSEYVTDTARFVVTGKGTTLRAVRAMVPAHAATLKKSMGWQATTQVVDNGIALSITGLDATGLQRVKGLGFFGVMATGSHHQAHHLQMAKGRMHTHHSR